MSKDKVEKLPGFGDNDLRKLAERFTAASLADSLRDGIGESETYSAALGQAIATIALVDAVAELTKAVKSLKSNGRTG